MCDSSPVWKGEKRLSLVYAHSFIENDDRLEIKQTFFFIYLLSFSNYVFKKNEFEPLKFVGVKFDFLGGYGLHFYT